MEREEFATRRRTQQDEFAATLRPLVVAALSSGDWTEVLDKASDLYALIYAEQQPERLVAAGDPSDLTELLKALRANFRQTQPDSDADAIALMIALAVMNAATVAVFKDSPDHVQEWVTMHDNKVRDTHEEADGQQRPVGQMFNIGGVPMPYPGWPGAPVELWIRCRCVLMPANATQASLSSNVDSLGQTDPEPAEQGERTMTNTTWHGVLAPEGLRSGDGRMFKEGSLRMRNLPLPLTWQKVSDEGHDSNVTVAKIEKMQRVDGEIRATGTWLSIPEAEEASALVEEFGRYGVSIDADDIDQSTLSIELDDNGKETLTFADARVCSACIVSIPAFAEAWVSNGDAPEGFFTEDEADSLVAAGGGWCAPSEWFKKPKKAKGGINFDGDRVFGYIAEWGVCHITFPDTCVEAPESASNYAYFLTGEVETDSGEFVQVGALTVDTGHANGNLRARPAASHYDNTGTVWAYVAVGEDDRGIWFSGMVKPGVDEDTINTVRASGRLSGDWRKIDDNFELVAALTVNVPGFPIQRPSALVASGEQVSLIAAGVSSPDAVATTTIKADLGEDVIKQIAAAIVDENVAREKRRAEMAELRDQFQMEQV